MYVATLHYWEPNKETKRHTPLASSLPHFKVSQFGLLWFLPLHLSVLLANFRSQRSDFFLENLSKCIVVPVARRMSQQAANNLWATGTTIHNKGGSHEKNRILPSDNSPICGLLMDRECFISESNKIKCLIFRLIWPRILARLKLVSLSIFLEVSMAPGMHEEASSIDSPVGRRAVSRANRSHAFKLYITPIATTATCKFGQLHTYLLTHLHALASLDLLNFARGTDGPVPRRRQGL